MNDEVEAGEPDSKHRILAETFGYRSFRLGQEAVIDQILAGKHVLAVMPTGAGKSLCYQVPALALGGVAVVVSPLIALMQDQVNALRLNGVAAEAINSAKSREENVQAWRRVMQGETRLLYMAPERLMTGRMLAALKKLPLSLFAIDEAHCISQWGHSFRAEYLELGTLRHAFPEVPIAALTATADRLTRDEIVEKIFGGDAAVFISGFDRPNLHLAVEAKQTPKRQLLDFLERHQGESGIVYCLSRRKVEETRDFLAAEGKKAFAYHAGMDSADRQICQERFLAEPGTIIVATIAFGMGIDKPDVRFVAHMDIPASVEAYYQEIGRAGRDGKPAEVMMLYGLDDIRMRRMFIDQSDAGDDKKRTEHRRLDALLAYCEAPVCRRQTLLAYFSETIDACGNCDLCLHPQPVVDGTSEARTVLEAVRDTDQMFGVGHVVDTILGKSTDKIERFGHDRVAVFGRGKDRSRPEWQSIIRQMVAGGLLSIDMAKYGSLKLTARSADLLAGDHPFQIRLDCLKRSKPAKGERRATKAAPLASLSDGDEGLLGHLKQVRMRLARERGVPAYVIFPDRALHDMAIKKPGTIDEFAEVHGVGHAKLRDFAAIFVEAIRDQQSASA
ncbi:MAG: DNA helicase RecQ [Alphaproteobacteria bacterium]|nr:DNA helicase RecQ [Alphaproteobacteria bacterium]